MDLFYKKLQYNFMLQCGWSYTGTSNGVDTADMSEPSTLSVDLRPVVDELEVCSEKVKSGNAVDPLSAFSLLFRKNSFRMIGSSKSGSSRFQFSSLSTADSK